MTQPDFTDEEMVRLRVLLSNDQQLRAIVVNDERVAWLWAVTRKWVGGVAVVLASAVAFRDDLRSLVLWITGRS